MKTNTFKQPSSISRKRKQVYEIIEICLGMIIVAVIIIASMFLG